MLGRGSSRFGAIVSGMEEGEACEEYEGELNKIDLFSSVRRVQGRSSICKQQVHAGSTTVAV